MKNNLIVNIKRRREKPKVGDYVLASLCSDVSSEHPWDVGHVEKITNGYTMFNAYKVNGRWYRRAWLLKNDEEGSEIIEYLKRSSTYSNSR